MSLSSSLWMGNLDSYMDEVFISTAFEQLGEKVIHVKLVKNKDPGVSSGCCFVDFGEAEKASQVLIRVNGKNIPDSNPTKRFKLNPSSYSKDHVLLPEFSVHVGDLSSEVDDLQLYSVFAKRYRSVRAAKVVLGGKNKGYGFVRFSDEEDQLNAASEMQHYNGIGRYPIRVSIAQTRGSEYSYSSSKHRRDHDSGGSNHNYYSQYPSSSYPGGGGYAWGGYSTNYNPYCPPTSQQDPLNPTYDEDMEALEDPAIEVNINRENREFMESSESFFEALDKSRWFPLDNLTSQLESPS